MLSKEDLDLIFMSYNVGKVLSYEKFEKGSGQLNFKVNTLTDSFVLKYFIKEIKKDNIVFDVNFNYFLEKNSFKCPRIIKNKHDNCIGELNGKPYILYEFIEGEHVENQNENQKEELIKNIAMLHNITIGLTELKSEWRYNYNVPESIDFMHSIINSKNRLVQESELSWILDEFHKLDLPEMLPQGLCHSDLYYRNYFFEGNDFKALIDLDDINYTFLIFDVTELVALFKKSFKVATYKQYGLGDEVFDFEAVTETVKRYSKYRKLSDLEKYHLYDVYKLNYLITIIWLLDYGIGDFPDSFEKRKIELLNTLGRTEFYNKIFKGV